MTAQLAFVTGPADPPTITETVPVLARSFDPGTPSFQAGPDSVGGEFSYRTVHFVVQVDGTYSASSTKMQTILRQVTAARNWLMVKATPTAKPMFFRTYRTQQPGGLEWANSGPGVWDLDVELVCDPWLVGDRQDLTVHGFSNDLAGNTPVWSFSGIKGDLRTPTVIWSSVPGASQALLATSSVVPPITIEAETGTNGTATTSVSADATLSGSAGKLYTPAGSTAVQSITGLTVPAGSLPGDYKVLARIRKSVAGDVFNFGLDADVAAPVRIESATTAQVVELDGARISLLRDTAGFDAALAVDAITFNLWIQRVSGTGTLTVDWLALIPTSDADMTFARVTTGTSIGAAVVLDAQTQDAWWTAASTGPFVAGARNDNMAGTDVRGGLPYLTPGATNYLGIWFQSASASLANRNFNVSYWPLYLHLRPDST